MSNSILDQASFEEEQAIYSTGVASGAGTWIASGGSLHSVVVSAECPILCETDCKRNEIVGGPVVT